MLQSVGVWYYSQNNQQLGPVTEEVLKSKARSGQLARTTLVWKEGMSDWKPLIDVPEIALALHAPVAIPPPVSAADNVYVSPQPYAGQNFPTAINSGGIFAFAIVTSVISLCVCNIISLVLGVSAIVYASQISGKEAIGDFISARSGAKTSKLLSWIGVALIIIIGVIYFAFNASYINETPQIRTFIK
jgi:hypothetical protein